MQLNKVGKLSEETFSKKFIKLLIANLYHANIKVGQNTRILFIFYEHDAKLKIPSEI